MSVEDIFFVPHQTQLRRHVIPSIRNLSTHLWLAATMHEITEPPWLQAVSHRDFVSTEFEIATISRRWEHRRLPSMPTLHVSYHVRLLTKCI